MQNKSNGNGHEPNGMPSFGMSSSAHSKSSSSDLARLQRSLGDGEEKRRFSANDYLRLLWKGKWIIAACVAVAALLTAYYTYSLPFIYEASVDISVNERDQEPVFGQTMWPVNRDRALKNELQFMESQSVYEQTAEELLRRRFLDTNHMQPTDSIIPIVKAAETQLMPKLHGATPEARKARLVGQLAGMVQSLTSVSPSKDADIITITTRSGDPREAALITNTYAIVYHIHSQEKNREKLRATETFLKGKLDTTDKMLESTEDQLESFSTAHGLVGEGPDGSQLMAQKSELENALSTVNIEINSVSSRRAETQKSLSTIEPTFVQETSL
ncbi:MAG: hypothetical protein H7X80_09270, partial [bacterium]|nr:hypothetical protein [Candidatus Kapabacteria bacterium]